MRIVERMQIWCTFTSLNTNKEYKEWSRRSQSHQNQNTTAGRSGSAAVILRWCCGDALVLLKVK